MHVTVKGGTNAGWRKAPKTQVKHDWRCPSCSATVRHYWRTCPNCNHPRPH